MTITISTYASDHQWLKDQNCVVTFQLYSHYFHFQFQQEQLNHFSVDSTQNLNLFISSKSKHPSRFCFFSLNTVHNIVTKSFLRLENEKKNR